MEALIGLALHVGLPVLGVIGGGIWALFTAPKGKTSIWAAALSAGSKAAAPSSAQAVAGPSIADRVGSFFGMDGRKKRMALILILIGLLVLVPHLRTRYAEHDAAEAKRTAEALNEQLIVERTQTEVTRQQLQAESDARAKEKIHYEASMADSQRFIEEKTKREATIDNRLRELSNALKERKAGNTSRGDSAVILRNLGQVGVSSVRNDSAGGETGPGARAAPMPDVLDAAPNSGTDVGPNGPGIGGPAVGGIRDTSQASGG